MQPSGAGSVLNGFSKRGGKIHAEVNNPVLQADVGFKQTAD